MIPPLPTSQGPEDRAFVDVPLVTDSLGRVIARGRRWIFVEVNCPACESVKDNLEELEAEAESLTTVLVCGGKASQALEWLAEAPNWVSVVTDEEKELFELFGVKKPPYFVGLNEQGLCVSKGVISVDLDARASLRRYRDSLSGPQPAAA